MDREESAHVLERSEYRTSPDADYDSWLLLEEVPHTAPTADGKAAEEVTERPAEKEALAETAEKTAQMQLTAEDVRGEWKAANICGTPGCYLRDHHFEPCTPFAIPGARPRRPPVRMYE